jgi:hypothetical protein
LREFIGVASGIIACCRKDFRSQFTTTWKETWRACGGCSIVEEIRHGRDSSSKHAEPDAAADAGKALSVVPDAIGPAQLRFPLAAQLLMPRWMTGGILLQDFRLWQKTFTH